MSGGLRSAGEVLWRAARRFVSDEGPLRATGLAYVTLLALVPLSAVAFGVLAAFPSFERLVGRIHAFVFAHFVPETGAAVARVVEALAANAARLSLVGALMLVATALLMMAAVDDTLNRIWGVRDRAGLWRRVTVWWTVLTLGPLLLGTALVLAMQAGRWLPQAVGALAPQRLLLEALAFVLEAGACLLLYALVPRRPVPLRHALAGALVAAVLLELARRGFGAYLARVDTYRTLYGPLAALPVLLIWVQVSWMIVLYGAEVSRTLGLAPGAGGGRGLDLAVRVLGRLAAAQRTGEAPGLGALARAGLADPRVLAPVLERLERAGLVRRTADGGWVLARALEAATVADLLEALGQGVPSVDASRDPVLARLGDLLAEGGAALYRCAPERKEGE